MGCPTGRQAYYITVQVASDVGDQPQVLTESTTRCMQVRRRMSTPGRRTPSTLRAEVNGALARTGQRIAAELLGADKCPIAGFSQTSRQMQAKR